MPVWHLSRTLQFGNVGRRRAMAYDCFQQACAPGLRAGLWLRRRTGRQCLAQIAKGAAALPPQEDHKAHFACLSMPLYAQMMNFYHDADCVSPHWRPFKKQTCVLQEFWENAPDCSRTLHRGRAVLISRPTNAGQDKASGPSRYPRSNRPVPSGHTSSCSYSRTKPDMHMPHDALRPCCPRDLF